MIGASSLGNGSGNSVGSSSNAEAASAARWSVSVTGAAGEAPEDTPGSWRGNYEMTTAWAMLVSGDDGRGYAGHHIVLVGSLLGRGVIITAIHNLLIHISLCSMSPLVV